MPHIPKTNLSPFSTAKVWTVRSVPIWDIGVGSVYWTFKDSSHLRCQRKWTPVLTQFLEYILDDTAHPFLARLSLPELLYPMWSKIATGSPSHQTVNWPCLIPSLKACKYVRNMDITYGRMVLKTPNRINHRQNFGTSTFLPLIVNHRTQYLIAGLRTTVCSPTSNLPVFFLLTIRYQVRCRFLIDADQPGLFYNTFHYFYCLHRVDLYHLGILL